MNELTAHPDLEAECKRLADINDKLMDNNRRLVERNEEQKAKLMDMDYKLKCLYEENQKMKAQLDMVYLIFGKR